MKILSMTATFGKLSRQTLTFEPGINIIEAPNEWGKSTWCAFLMAMLYGIDTGSRTKTGFLADKEHYAPWSGEPMSGSMDIAWQGREITIQRQNKGRVPFGDVRAFETHTGVPVPELAVAAPGQVLLGVERSVFARAGFLKLSEMPVTEDESLRRRLNELVTTGDESGASDDLAQKLRDLKNKCRFNKKGLLPELEARQADLQQKLQQLQALQYQITTITERQKALEETTRALENHKQALAYAAHRQYSGKLLAAQVNRESAARRVRLAEIDCKGLPGPEEIREKLSRLQQLRDTRDSLRTKAQLLPPMPPVPEAPAPFRGKTPEQAAAEARQAAQALRQLVAATKKPMGYILGGVLLVLGIVLLMLQPVAGAAVLAAGLGALAFPLIRQNQLKKKIAALTGRYAGIPADRWETAAAEYANAQRAYQDTLNTRHRETAELNSQLDKTDAGIADLTGGESLGEFEETCRRQQLAHANLQEQRRALQQAEEVLQALSGAAQQVAPPMFEDTLTLTAEQTERQLVEDSGEKQLLHQRLGQCQGQMDALGQEEALQTQLQQVQGRITALEKYYRALVRAQEILLQATQELQRRFAPRISKRAQELFARLTDQRYQRLTLGQDMSVEAGAEGENTLRGTLWRSDGTVDQLYLALRLAVAEELTPDAPLVLDDALVRFDDARLKAALEILKDTQKQVILFTCQSRERQISKEETL